MIIILKQDATKEDADAILKEIERNEKPRIILLDETGMVDSIKLHKLIELDH